MWFGACAEQPDVCYTNAGLVHTLDTGFERDWMTFFWAVERSDGCDIDL